MLTDNSSEYLNYYCEKIAKPLEWVSTFVLMFISLFRSWNLGYQQQAYFISSMFQIPMIIKAVRTSDNQLLIMNVFYFVNGIIATYRWG